MANYLAPTFGAGYQAFNNNGLPLANGYIYTYSAGTSTPLATYIASTGSVVNTNPIQLDTTGRPPQEIWFATGSAYKFVLTDSLGGQIGPSNDNLQGINDPAFTSTGTSVAEWNSSGLTPSYVNSTTFTVSGNATNTYQPNRRIQAIVSAGTIYGYISTSTFTSLTTVVIVPDSTGLDFGVSAVNVALLSANNPSVPQSYAKINSPVGLTAPTFTGNLIGNVTATTLIGTLSTAAQGNITSLGNLTGLTVNGLIYSTNGSDIAIKGNTTGSHSALVGIASAGDGVDGYSSSGYGIYGSSGTSIGVYGTSTSSFALYGTSSTGIGVFGTSIYSIGVVGNFVGTTGYTVGGTLPGPSATYKGARAYVTNSLVAMATNYGSIVASGGAFIVPVFCDGTNWLIG